MGTRLSVEGGTAVCTSRSSGVALGQLADAQQRAAPPPWSRGLGGARGDADGQQTAELRPGGEEGDSSGRGDLEVGVADGVEHRRAGDPFGPAEQRDEVYQQVGGRREDSQPGAPCGAAQLGDDQGGDRAEDSGEEQDVGEHPDQTERVKVRADGQGPITSPHVAPAVMTAAPNVSARSRCQIRAAQDSGAGEDQFEATLLEIRHPSGGLGEDVGGDDRDDDLRRERQVLLAVGAQLDPLGLIRAFTDVLLAAVFGAVAALVVAWLRGTAGGAGLAIFTAASYLLIYLVPLFGWPEWVARPSVFDAIGNPYLEIPAAGGITFLAAWAKLGSLLAVGVAARSPKTA